MPTPAKPISVIKMEGKSHRTKKEKERREKEEAKLLSGTILKERKDVRANPVAHKEFLRIEKVLKKIEKNDAIYESVINRYCILQAECADLETKREKIYDLIFDLEESFEKSADEMDPKERAFTLIEFSKNMAKLGATMIACDKQVQAKRKMLLDIEKENVMTIAAALRSIPKKEKEEEEEDPMLFLLNQRRAR